MSRPKYDFGGMATKANLLCDDGAVIGRGAFSDQDGKTVPLCWQHQHNDPENVLGHATLSSTADGGMYCMCSFNNSPKAQSAKEAVRNGDIDSLSIFANKLTRNNNVVTHGTIREVSLVFAGANPGAKIDYVDIEHSADGGIELYHSALDEETGYQIATDQAIIHSGEQFDYISDELEHSCNSAKKDKINDNSEEENQEENMEENEMDENKKEVKHDAITLSKEEMNDMLYHAAATAVAAKDAEDNETLQDVYDTFNDKQKKAVQAILALALEKEGKTDEVKQSAIYDTAYENGYNDAIDKANDYIAQSGINGGDEVKTNVFDQNQGSNEAIMHSALEDARADILSEAKRCGSFKQAFKDYTNNQDFLAHAAATGISNISNLFPEAQLVGDKPFIIKDDDEWVKYVMAGVSKQMFGRIKSIGVNFTGEEARAKGYVKGALKTNIQLASLKRYTNPTMVYAKADLDRQDIIEITDFNVISVLKQGIEVALKQIVAEQILFSDQREATSPDKIDNACIRPIAFDDAVYTIRKTITLADTATGKETADLFRKTILNALKEYKGSGTKTMFTTNELINNMMLAQDTIGHDMYDTEDKLAAAMRCKKIMEVIPMSTAKYVDDTDKSYDILAIIVDLRDYVIGLPRGGEITNFEDFDLNYNQMIYLTETYMSGALIRPYSAIVIQRETAVTSPLG